MSRKPKKSSWLLSLLLWPMLLIVVGACVGTGYAWYWLHLPISGLKDGAYEVTRGSSAYSIAHDLQQRGWMQYPQLWRAWAHVTHKAELIKAGEYALHPDMSP